MFARLFLLLFFLGNTLVAGGPARSGDLLPEELILMLQGGGYVVFVNHIETEEETEIAPEIAPDLQCAHPTTLTPLGAAKARAIGGGFARLDIPIQEVVAAPCCGAWEMARLAFGARDVVIRPNDHALRQVATPLDVAPATNAEVEGPPPAMRDGNRILVGHAPALKVVIPGASTVPGAAHVMRRSADGLVLRGIIPPDAWLGF